MRKRLCALARGARQLDTRIDLVAAEHGHVLHARGPRARVPICRLHIGTVAARFKGCARRLEGVLEVRSLECAVHGLMRRKHAQHLGTPRARRRQCVQGYRCIGRGVVRGRRGNGFARCCQVAVRLDECGERGGRRKTLDVCAQREALCGGRQHDVHGGIHVLEEARRQLPPLGVGQGTQRGTQPCDTVRRGVPGIAKRLRAQLCVPRDKHRRAVHAGIHAGAANDGVGVLGAHGGCERAGDRLVERVKEAIEQHAFRGDVLARGVKVAQRLLHADETQRRTFPVALCEVSIDLRLDRRPGLGCTQRVARRLHAVLDLRKAVQLGERRGFGRTRSRGFGDERVLGVLECRAQRLRVARKVLGFVGGLGSDGARDVHLRAQLRGERGLLLAHVVGQRAQRRSDVRQVRSAPLREALRPCASRLGGRARRHAHSVCEPRRTVVLHGRHGGHGRMTKTSCRLYGALSF